MSLVEINFDGIIGPTHNFAGLSVGNLAATAHAGQVSYPRAAALQGLEKMRANLALGLVQGFFAPLPRPNPVWLEALAVDSTTDPVLAAGAWSASAMWAANAATVSPSPDTRDGRCHLTVANLVTMPHRAHEWPDTLKQLQLAFADAAHFAVHEPAPPCFGDEGAANHMRLASVHGAPGLEIFVLRPQRQAPSPPASTSRPAAWSLAATASTRSGCCSSSKARKRSPRARSTTMSWPWPTSACCSSTSRPSPTRAPPMPRSASGFPRSRSSSCLRPR